MDPIDSRPAPIAMSILRYAAQNISIAEIERAVRSAIGFANMPGDRSKGTSRMNSALLRSKETQKRMERPMKEIAVLLTAVPALAADTSTNNKPASSTSSGPGVKGAPQAHRPELRILNHLRMQKASKEPRATRAARLRSLTPRGKVIYTNPRRRANPCDP